MFHGYLAAADFTDGNRSGEDSVDAVPGFSCHFSRAKECIEASHGNQIAEEGIKSGKIIFIFQPAEETGAGTIAMIETGLLSGLKEVVGIHLRPQRELKLGQATPAMLRGAAIKMCVGIKGLSSNGVWPHVGINAVDAGAMAVNAVNAVKADPRVSHSAKLPGSIPGGQRSISSLIPLI